MEVQNKLGLGIGGTGPMKSILVTSDLSTDVRGLLGRFGYDDVTGETLIFSSIDEAVGACLTGKGDRIFVAPGHTETVTATSIALDVAGIEIIGLGNGGARPTLTFSAAASTITVSAANITIRNCICIANKADVVTAFTLTTAKDFKISGCEFRDTTAILNFIAIVTTAATSNGADGLVIENSKRIGLGATTNTTIISMVGTNDRLIVKGNYFAHAAVTLGGLMIIATGKVVTNAEIEDNKINLVSAANATGGIIITTNGSTNSGYINNNRVWSLDTTTPILVTASSGFKYGVNYYSGDADASGYTIPAADS